MPTCSVVAINELNYGKRELGPWERRDGSCWLQELSAKYPNMRLNVLSNDLNTNSTWKEILQQGYILAKKLLKLWSEEMVWKLAHKNIWVEVTNKVIGHSNDFHVPWHRRHNIVKGTI